ncbi:MAG TPA: (Fe-S)-binding protein [Bacteroidota bacterium]|nr:(Fe-S)-binding protein [Bacteroidota bacterium]
MGTDIPDYDFITNCMHCGLCLPTCPTYAVTGLEKSSPRGRIRLIKAVADGEMEITPGFIEEMNFCLDCQACETACPAGVKYGSLVESSRAQIFQQGKVSWLERGMKWLFLKHVLASKVALKFIARLLRIFQRSGLQRILSSSHFSRHVMPKLTGMMQLSPRIDRQFFDDFVGEIITPSGAVKHRVAFLSGCIMNVAFSDINRDTVDVLLKNECEVVIPRRQECCGSLHAHNGDFETARALARHNIDIFLKSNVDAIVMNSAGCGAFMKEYERYLVDDGLYAEKAREVSSKVKDLTEFLIEIDFKKPSSILKGRVTYHDACHLAHAQKVTSEPRSILNAISGLDIVELPEAAWCCGSAGIYNVVRYEDSMKFLERKISNLRATAAEIIVTNNPGCISQIKYGLSQKGIAGEVVHIATILNRAYRAEEERPRHTF